MSRPGFKLTAWAEDENRDYRLNSTSCYCHICPPCGDCLHPGNPANQAEDDSCWESITPVLRFPKSVTSRRSKNRGSR